MYIWFSAQRDTLQQLAQIYGVCFPISKNKEGLNNGIIEPPKIRFHSTVTSLQWLTLAQTHDLPFHSKPTM